MKAKRLLFLVMAICLTSGVYAQFYDGPDDIRFYVVFKENGEVDKSCNVYVFNFDGMQACFWCTTVSGVERELRNNPNFFEDEIETKEYDLKYISNNLYKVGGEKDYREFKFSYNRKSMEFHWYYYIYNMWSPLNSSSHDIRHTYTEVDRSFFRKKVGRSKSPSGKIYE